MRTKKPLTERAVCWLSCAALLVIWTSISAPPGFSQTATVSGKITDQSGALIPGAGVTAQNVRSGTKSTTASNGQGAYVIPFLQPGLYTLSVKKQGFRSIVRPNVKLEVDQTVGIDFVMQLGSVVQTIHVQGGAPALQTQTASLGQQIENKTIVTLPLNGRDYTQLVTLGAGAAPNHYSRAKNGFSLNGGETFQTKMLLDGIDNEDYILGIDTSTINALTPSVDAIQEFKVETANYSAQYGRAAGGIVSVTLKSGTNEFHGDAFEFLRNDALDANDFFANRTGLHRPPLRRNQFGGTLGGPIVHNHSFFFVSYQGTRQESAISGAITVPTQALAQGDFGSVPIYDPLNVVNGVRQEFPGNKIPANRIDPVGRKLAALYPSPNLPGKVNNFAFNQSELNNADEFDSRFDEQFSGRDSAYLTYSRGSGAIDQGPVFASPGNGGGGFNHYPLNQPILAYSIAVAETHIFSSSMVNEFHGGYTHNQSNQLPPESQPLFQQFGLQGIPPLAGLNGLPQIAMTGFSSLGDRTFAPNPKLVQVSQANDTVSWIRGNHAVKFGGELLITHDYAGTSNAARGNISFTGQFTSQVSGKGQGSALADLLLGQTSSANITTQLVGRFRSDYYGLFANDTWRVSRKLTLDLGVRYDLQTPLYERDNHMSNFDYNPASAAFGTLVPAKAGSTLSRTFSNLDTNNFAPRLGLAYRLTSKTVLRSAFGIFYGGLGYQDIAHSGAANVPNFFSVTVPSATNATVSSLVLSNGFPQGLLTPANAKNPNGFSLAANFPMPAVYQWNFSVERELPGHSSLTAAYVGSSTSDLLGDNSINAPPPGPGAINPRRPFPSFGDINYQSPYAHATYNAFQVTYQRHFLNGFSLLSDYTWSHSLDNVLSNEDNVGGGQPQNPQDTAAEKAPSGFDIRQRFVTSAVYQLPLGSPGRFLGRTALSRTIFGGWELGPIFVAQSGNPETPIVSPKPSNTTTPARPDRLCGGNLPARQRNVIRWYDVACFVPSAPFTFGNSARGVVRAPGLVNLDLLVDRTFHFTESKSLEFRAEFFNFTNTAHFGAPDMTVNTPEAGQITSDASPNREIQFALRFLF